ncbi:accessory factor associated with RNA polymerase II [Acarospora aff. strigata]|nr:accessory factor associated with RNA polymerase II [Acarospora aff. strigata]
MSATSTPLARHISPPFFQSWALRRSENDDLRTSSPSVSPACVDYVDRQHVVERHDSKRTRLPRSPGPSHQNAVSFHKPNNDPSALEDAATQSASEYREPYHSVDSSPLRPAYSRTSSSTSRILKLFKLPAGSKFTEEAQSPPSQKPSGLSVKETKHRRRRSFLSSLERATIDNPVSTPTLGHHKSSASKADKTTPPAAKPKIRIGSSNAHRRGLKGGGSRRDSSIDILYTRAKHLFRSLGRRYSSDLDGLDPSGPQMRSNTSSLLHRVSSALTHHKPNNPNALTLTASSSSTASASSVLAHYLHNKQPTVSRSTSIQQLLMGRTPTNTPDSDALYGGADDREFFRVEISDPNGPTFLPSEARRIGTPPLPSDGGPGGRGRLRGFFFDLNAPDDESSPSSDGDGHDDGDGQDTPKPTSASKLSRANTKAAAVAARSANERRSAKHHVNDWFSLQLMVEDARDHPEESFELNVPEHLLGSPLCPRSALHESGGRGVCVYHGRNRDPVEG